MFSGCSEVLGFPRPEFESWKQFNFSELHFFICRMKMIISTSCGYGRSLIKFGERCCRCCHGLWLVSFKDTHIDICCYFFGDIYWGALKALLTVYNCFFCFPFITVSLIALVPVSPFISHCLWLISGLVIFPLKYCWKKRSEFLKAASFFPSKMSTRHVLYET